VVILLVVWVVKGTLFHPSTCTGEYKFTFGLFREYVEDYPEIAIRELLINALAHRDYSRQQIIEIRKYPTYLEIESPGLFPEGITSENYLRKSNPATQHHGCAA
jgi:predicted HTH transcriptional regulator